MVGQAGASRALPGPEQMPRDISKSTSLPHPVRRGLCPLESFVYLLAWIFVLGEERVGPQRAVVLGHLSLLSYTGRVTTAPSKVRRLQAAGERLLVFP